MYLTLRKENANEVIGLNLRECRVPLKSRNNKKALECKTEKEYDTKSKTKQSRNELEKNAIMWC